MVKKKNVEIYLEMPYIHQCHFSIFPMRCIISVHARLTCLAKPELCVL